MPASGLEAPAASSDRPTYEECVEKSARVYAEWLAERAISRAV